MWTSIMGFYMVRPKREMGSICGPNVQAYQISIFVFRNMLIIFPVINKIRVYYYVYNREILNYDHESKERLYYVDIQNKDTNYLIYTYNLFEYKTLKK